MINEKHEELGNAVNFLISNKCCIKISKEHRHDMVARVYNGEEDMKLEYPRFAIVSREGYSGLIAYGDITSDGKVCYGWTPKMIALMYQKWIDEGKPSKAFTTTLIKKDVDFTDEKLEWASLELRDWALENIPNEFIDKLEQASKDPNLSEMCRDVFEEVVLQLKALDKSEDIEVECAVPDDAIDFNFADEDIEAPKK